MFNAIISFSSNQSATIEDLLSCGSIAKAKFVQVICHLIKMFCRLLATHTVRLSVLWIVLKQCWIWWMIKGYWFAKRSNKVNMKYYYSPLAQIIKSFYGRHYFFLGNGDQLRCLCNFVYIDRNVHWFKILFNFTARKVPNGFQTQKGYLVINHAFWWRIR